jgi:hypothetical protein
MLVLEHYAAKLRWLNSVRPVHPVRPARAVSANPEPKCFGERIGVVSVIIEEEINSVVSTHPSMRIYERLYFPRCASSNIV